MAKKVVEVAVGVIKRDEHIFITKRDESQHQGGLWEFPGGKIEAGESVTEALARELREEVNIDVHSSQSLLDIEHDYGDKCVKLLLECVQLSNVLPLGGRNALVLQENSSRKGGYIFLSDRSKYVL